HLAAGLVELGLLANDIDEATHHVLAEQGTLGAAQHFDALHVEHVEHLAHGGVEGHAIHRHQHGGVNGLLHILVADPADGETAVGGGSRLDGVHHHVGGELGEGGGVEGKGVGDVVAGDGADRHRHILDALLAFTGGDHHFLEGRLGEHRDGGDAP